MFLNANKNSLNDLYYKLNYVNIRKVYKVLHWCHTVQDIDERLSESRYCF